MTAPDYPLQRYMGSKWRIAPWVVSHLPAHTVYVETHGGAAAVLLNKPRSPGEIYNDIDGDVVNVFRVLRDEQKARRLKELLYLTPYAREEYDHLYLPPLMSGDVERARVFIARGFMGSNSKGAHRKSGFDNRVNTDGYISRLHSFQHAAEVVEQHAARLRGVLIENRPAVAVVEEYDSPQTLFYVDPPYLPETRSGRYYANEMTPDDHRELAATLRAAQGMVVVSGYASSLYDQELYPDWHREERPVHTDGAHARTEVLWIKPNSVHRPRLF